MGLLANRSPAMVDRRHRILAETRRMIARSGYEDFSIRELARLAGVSSRTIYNAFAGKDQLIALAIRGYFQQFQSRIALSVDPATLDGAVDRQIAVTLRNLAIPNYLAAISSIYFSPSIPANVRQVLVEIGVFQWSEWLKTARAGHNLEPWTDSDVLLRNLSDLQFLEVHNWRTGLFGDEQLLPRTLDAVLTMLAGTTRGEAREHVRSLLRHLHEGTPEWDRRCNRIGEQLDLLALAKRTAPENAL